MASIYNLKVNFQNLLRPLSDWLAKQGVRPNAITLSAMILSLLMGTAICLYPEMKWVLLSVPIVLFIRMALNAIDGMLAREHHMQTALGTFLNELGDVFSDAFLYLPLCFVPGISIILIVSMIMIAIIAEMTGVVAVQIGGKRRYDGPMGKSDRAFAFGTIYLLLGSGWLSAEKYLNILLVILLILQIKTIFNRIINGLQEINYGS